MEATGTANHPLGLTMLQCLPTTTRPPCSYVALIAMAIASAPDGRMTLAEIYRYIARRFPYFRLGGGRNDLDARRWQNSIRHNLSLNDCFVRVERSAAAGEKVGYWTLHPLCHDMFVDGSLLRRARRFRAPPPSHQPLPTAVDHVPHHQYHAAPNTTGLLQSSTSGVYAGYSVGSYHAAARPDLELAFGTNGMRVGPFVCRRRGQIDVETVNRQLCHWKHHPTPAAVASNDHLTHRQYSNCQWVPYKYCADNSQ